MSAKRTQTAVIIALTQLVWLGTTHRSRAVTPDGTSAERMPTAQGAPQKPITREDAELMLREAHGAIEQGRLDKAEELLSRVEKAHVNFSFFHVGPTPASVRRELSRAQHLAHVAGKSSHQSGNTALQSHLPFSRDTRESTESMEDPFAARNMSSAPKAGGMTTAASALSSPEPSSRGLGTIAAPEHLASQSASPNQQHTANPYSGLATGADFQTNGSSAEVQNFLNGSKYPVMQASAGSNPFRAADSTGARNSAGTPAHDEDPYAARSLSERTADESPAQGSTPKQQAKADLVAARKALEAGDVEQAEKLTRAANALGVPESEYLPNEDRPSLIAWDIARAKQKGQTAHASPPTIERLPATTPSRYESQPGDPADLGLSPTAQTSEAMPAAYRLNEGDPKGEPMTLPMLPESNRVTSLPSTSTALPSEPPILQPTGEGPRILSAAPIAMPESYRIASAGAAPSTETLPSPDAGESKNAPTAETASPTQGKASLIDTADAKQQALAQQLSTEVGKRQSDAQRLREKDPERALAALHEAQQLVNDSKLSDSTKRELLNRIDITLSKVEKYSKDHKSEIALDKQNQAVLNDRDREQEMKLKLQQKIAEMVEEFNRLRDEQRFEEMEIIARRLNELAPDDPVAQQVWQNAKFIRREMMNRQLADKKEDSVWRQLNAVEESAVNPVADDGHELVRDQKYWDQFVKNRKGSSERIQRRNERELEIERRLKTPVLLKYQETPLSEVMSGLSELTGVNIHLDPRGLTQEGINSDTPITISLTKEISLKSALNLILEPLHLSYVINDEVLKITSEQLRDGQIYAHTYNVADLVTPIPNFVPSNNIGLQGLINESMAATNQGKPGFASTSPTVLVNDRSQKAGAGANGNVLAQQFNAAPTNGMSPSTVPIGAGPGGMGAGANADFDSLIDLIVSTVATDTWAENGGGEAEIRPFPTNLSLVISQTQAVHEEIADLLQQLRRLQDLQVTIEVRFIRLNDSFFERIGIDFDANIKDIGVNTNNQDQFQPNNLEGHSNTVGLQRQTGTSSFPDFTSDLSIPFNQDSFTLTQVVPFGGPVGGGANFGFAILSDIEAYFLIEAAQGDKRTNMLNAPKVTLFNGQQAFVADATQRPFVVGVIPVVGEFAAAQQPVIVVLNEGTMMTIQAVVSEDRRYVRMTIVPFFTQIGNVDTFTFQGSSSSTSSSSSATDSSGDSKSEKKDDSNSNNATGVTVQLPSFSFVSVVTTVSVPDGGTVLLGGIKRLNEGRNEFGVPLLSKVPYINRLFRNVSIGRTTDSLMMMVTPRIIIQEEEEERLGVSTPSTP